MIRKSYSHQMHQVHGAAEPGVGWNGSSFSGMSYHSIFIKELIPIMVALFLWGQKWRGHKVLAHCDNEAVVVILL